MVDKTEEILATLTAWCVAGYYAALHYECEEFADLLSGASFVCVVGLAVVLIANPFKRGDQ